MDSKRIKYYLLSEDDSLNKQLNATLAKKGFISGNRNRDLNQYDYIKNNVDVLVVNVDYQEVDCYELVSDIREKGINAPIIYIDPNNKGYNLSKVYMSGGNDFVKKPFCTEELSHRISALIGYKGYEKETDQNGMYKIGDYYFSYETNCVLYKDKTIKLSGRETEIIKMLITNKDGFVTKTNILKKLWGEANYFTARSLDVFISKIRKIFKDDEQIKIYTLRNLGYKFTDRLEG